MLAPGVRVVEGVAALAGRAPTGEVGTAMDVGLKLYMMHGNWMVLTGTRELDRLTVTI